jgi:predicted MPP superfamily phosphohydrolase
MNEQRGMRISRRNFLRLGIYSAPLICLADTFVVEPSWLTVKHLRLREQSTLRFIHFSDLHYNGDRAFLRKVMSQINELSPMFACFTGDIVEDKTYLAEALEIMALAKCPLYGVPGNHDYWSGASFAAIRECFKSTGGDWLVDQTTRTKDDACEIDGRSGVKIDTRSQASEFAMPGQRFDNISPIDAKVSSNDTGPSESSRFYVLDKKADSTPSTVGMKRILLTHYPALANRIPGEEYDLVLAGHSHGGQVRMPILGALIVPYGVDGYDAGLYSTPAGPLYVNVGIGTFLLPVRFLCRPELTIVEI